MDEQNNLLKRVLRTLTLSLIIITIVSVLILLYALITERQQILGLIFRANYVLASLLIVTGVLNLLFPSRIAARMKKSKLIDHSTYADVQQEEREKKQATGNNLLYLGITGILITGIAEVIIWLALVY